METVLFSTHNICFGYEIRKLIFNCTLLSRGLISLSYVQGNPLYTIATGFLGISINQKWKFSLFNSTVFSVLNNLSEPKEKENKLDDSGYIQEYR